MVLHEVLRKTIKDLEKKNEGAQRLEPDEDTLKILQDLANMLASIGMGIMKARRFCGSSVSMPAAIGMRIHSHRTFEQPVAKSRNSMLLSQLRSQFLSSSMSMFAVIGMRIHSHRTFEQPVAKSQN